MFSIKYGMEVIPENLEIIKRKAVKGVVFNGSNVLMIKTDRGDYKFPGGGIKNDENIEECLKREFLEETGYFLSYKGELLGDVIEQNYDLNDSKKIFSMHSSYYACEVDMSRQQSLNLDEYEKEQNFQPVFVDINEAINHNKRILDKHEEKMNPWVQRETNVLEEIKNKFIK